MLCIARSVPNSQTNRRGRQELSQYKRNSQTLPLETQTSLHPANRSLVKRVMEIETMNDATIVAVYETAARADAAMRDRKAAAVPCRATPRPDGVQNLSVGIAAR
jgi:hypothetical protein